MDKCALTWPLFVILDLHTMYNVPIYIIIILMNIMSPGFLQNMYDTSLLRHHGILGVQLVIELTNSSFTGGACGQADQAHTTYKAMVPKKVQGIALYTLYLAKAQLHSNKELPRDTLNLVLQASIWPDTFSFSPLWTLVHLSISSSIQHHILK